ncbi:hypothetical protein G9A89_022030 [Geosiphon pyriformis]|nr:hypothetical protein G9A89_022030 [Geosiphon pyriformis]
MEITINQQTIRYKNMAKIPQNKAQKRLENVVDKIMTKIKLTLKEQQIVRLRQELTRETWTCLPEGHDCQTKSGHHAEKKIGKTLGKIHLLSTLLNLCPLYKGLHQNLQIQHLQNLIHGSSF